MELKIDEEFKTLIPPLSADEFDQLKQNIISDGCREPLVVWNGVIVDGHNRYNICTKNDIPFKVLKKQFEDRNEVIRWIIMNQFGRRNLTPYQRSELAIRLKPLVEMKAKENQKLSEGRGKKGCQISDNLIQNKIDTKKELAKLAGVSHDTLKKSEVIKEAGTPEQKKRASQGGKGNSVNAIYNEIKAEQSGERKCSKCGKLKPVSEFKAGQTQCKECRTTSSKRYCNVKGEPILVDEKTNEFFKKKRKQNLRGNVR